MAAFAAQHLLPGIGYDIELVPRQIHREAGGSGVGEGQPGAVVGDPVAIGHAHARGRAVPGEDHIAGRIDRGEVGQRAIRRLEHRGIELELFDRIGHPAFAEAFPSEQRGRTGAEHRPHRHLDRAGIRAGNDADAVRGRHLQHLARQVDRILQPALAELAAMRAAERSDGELFRCPARRLRAGAG